MATHSSILAKKIPWREAWWAMTHGVSRVGHNLATTTIHYLETLGNKAA